jgi:hypothetical protein
MEFVPTAAGCGLLSRAVGDEQQVQVAVWALLGAGHAPEDQRPPAAVYQERPHPAEDAGEYLMIYLE